MEEFLRSEKGSFKPQKFHRSFNVIIVSILELPNKFKRSIQNKNWFIEQALNCVQS